MPRKRYSTEQIVTKLRQAEVEFGRGLRTPEMCKELGGASNRPIAGGKNTAACTSLGITSGPTTLARSGPMPAGR